MGLRIAAVHMCVNASMHTFYGVHDPPFPLRVRTNNNPKKTSDRAFFSFFAGKSDDIKQRVEQAVDRNTML